MRGAILVLLAMVVLFISVLAHIFGCMGKLAEVPCSEKIEKSGHQIVIQYLSPGQTYFDALALSPRTTKIVCEEEEFLKSIPKDQTIYINVEEKDQRTVTTRYLATSKNRDLVFVYEMYFTCPEGKIIYSFTDKTIVFGN